MNIVMVSDKGDSCCVSVTCETFSLVESIFLKNPRVVDGFGEKIIIGKCNKEQSSVRLSVCEISILEFEDSQDVTKSVSLSGLPSYEIQYGIYKLEGKQ